MSVFVQSDAVDGVVIDLSLRDALKGARTALAYDREILRSEGEWPRGVERTWVAVMLYRVTEKDRAPARCPYCDAEVGTPHTAECDEYEPENPDRVVVLDFDYTCDYGLVKVPGAIEAVLELASEGQLRAELARRDKT